MEKAKAGLVGDHPLQGRSEDENTVLFPFPVQSSLVKVNCF